MAIKGIRSGIISVLLILIMSSCASFRSGIKGEFQGDSKGNIGAGKVAILFKFSHIRQIKGLDAVPKLQNKGEIISRFDDIFNDALRELSNIGRYATYTEYASDVNNPERRSLRDSLIAVSDYLVEMELKTEKRFSSSFLKTLISIATVTLLPLPYSQSYSLETRVYNSREQLIRTYHRNAKLTTWVQPALILVYPFYPKERKEEEIYLEFLHNTFKQIESESVLAGSGS